MQFLSFIQFNCLRFNVDEQKIVGAIKSLEALGDLVSTQIFQVGLIKIRYF